MAETESGADPAPSRQDALAQQSRRRTIEAVAYGVGLLVSELEASSRDDLGKLDASGDRDGLFGHIRQLIEHSYGGEVRSAGL